MGKNRTVYGGMLFSMCLRLFWLTVMESKGLVTYVVSHQEYYALFLLPYFIYPSIVILIVIIAFALLKKRWAYMGGVIFGSVHTIVMMPTVVMYSGYCFGPIIILVSSLLMVIASYIMFKNTQPSSNTKRVSFT